MNTSPRKVALVVLYNHNYEKNIPVIRKIYGNRFSTVIQLMPFYYGHEPDVISVYGNSFVFHTYIAQVRERLMQTDCDDFLIVGDDVLLNPVITEFNVHETLGIRPGAFYIDKVNDVAAGGFTRPFDEATRFCTTPVGLDASANRILPSYEEAKSILRERGVLSGTSLSNRKPYFRPFHERSLKNLYANFKVLRSRWRQLKHCWRLRLKPLQMPYPCVFAYSDLINIPREHCDLWCRYLEVMATWQMFVELAIPTAMELIPNADICFATDCKLKTGNVWFPQDPEHFRTVQAVIDEVCLQAGGDADKLSDVFPSEYMYLHPVKLSKFR